MQCNAIHGMPKGRFVLIWCMAAAQSKCFLGKMFKEEKKSVMKQLFGTIASDDGEKRPNNACNLHIDAGVCGAVMH